MPGLSHYAVFARAGFTPAAATELTARQGLLINLPTLDEVLTSPAVIGSILGNVE